MTKKLFAKKTSNTTIIRKSPVAESKSQSKMESKLELKTESKPAAKTVDKTVTNKSPNHKQEKLDSFNPSAYAKTTNGIFGLPFNCEEADIVIVPVPWDATVSYRAGTANGPESVLQASYQVDLYDTDAPNLWRAGIAMQDISTKWTNQSKKLREKSADYIEQLTSGADMAKSKTAKTTLSEVNAASKELNHWLAAESAELLKQNKLVGVLGGEHSCSYGYIESLAQIYDSFGILQIDAHMDLRQAFEGFEFSHASAMYNALQIKQVKKLVQVGIRDFCEEEFTRVQESNNRIVCYTDQQLKRRSYDGISWRDTCDRIVNDLPKNVYVSFDIDGLNPLLCPNTGTPVAGGLQFEEAMYLINQIVASNRQIIGFDLCEVAPAKDNEWDANVGARVLFKLCSAIYRSNGRK